MQYMTYAGVLTRANAVTTNKRVYQKVRHALMQLAHKLLEQLPTGVPANMRRLSLTI